MLDFLGNTTGEKLDTVIYVVVASLVIYSLAALPWYLAGVI